MTTSHKPASARADGSNPCAFPSRVAPKFTAGPWRIETTDRTQGDWKWREIVAEHEGDHHVVLGEVYVDGSGYPFDRDAEANATLISAAPDLYARAEFLCARIRELEGEMTDDDELSRQYFGHVLPAVARMEGALSQARGEVA